MQRFNIALLPVDVAMQLHFAVLAQKHFSALADGYLLGAEALAHVTLCQFYAADETAASAVFHQWAGNPKKPIELLIQEFSYVEGRIEHAGKIWAWIMMERQAALLMSQRDCFEHLAQTGVKALTSPKTYVPHITLARLRLRPQHIPAECQNLPSSIEMRPVLGLSTENGVFVRELV